MSNSVIGALRVDLGLNSAQFSTGMKKAQSDLARVGAQMAKVGAAMAAAMTAAVAGIGFAVNRSIGDMDAMSKAAQKFGVPVEELSALAHAADLSGVSLDGLGTSLQKLSRNMSDVAAGAGAEAARAFSALDIAVTNADGTLRTSTDVLTDLADRFSRMPDGAQKTALAMQVMGRAGATMIPLLNAGRDGLAEMLAEAEALGLVMDTRTARAAERFNDNLTRLGKVKDGIITKLTAHMLPALEGLSQRLIDAVKSGDLVERMANGLTRAFDGLQRTVIFVYDNFGVLIRVGAALLALKAAAWAVAAGKAFAALASALRVATVAKVAFSAAVSLGRAGLVGLAGAAVLAASEYSGLTSIFSGVGDAIRGLTEAVGSRLEGALAAIGLDTRALTMELASLSVEIDGGTTPALAALAAAMGGTGSKARELGETIRSDVVPTIETVPGVMQSIAQTIEGAFTSTFDQLIQGTANVKDAIKSLLADLAKLLANAAFRALIGGGSGGGGILGALFRGFPGFATGGSFRVGGAGGVDSQLVAFRATPGEQVDVRTPGQVSSGGGAAEPVRIQVSISPTGEFDARVANTSVATANRVVLEYDKRVLPGRVRGIAGAGLRHGDIR